MKRTQKQLLIWLPRSLGILFALFLSLFALDVFDAGYGFWGTLLALFIHLIPVFFLLIGLAVAWRWEWVGVVVFWGFAAWYVIGFGGRFDWSVYALIMGPPLVVGLLFGVDWIYHRELHAG
ncbi:MAG: hypothetical protein U0350_39755 [Caldilineaceae bacterium]